MNLSAEDFLNQRFDLPEGGRGCELVRGEIVQYNPPDLAHGNVVLHLSKALAAYAQAHSGTAGATCFELGLRLAQSPDTVFFPAVSHFPDAGPFELSDLAFTDRVPALVVEVISDVGRSRAVAAKTPQYLGWGVREVWTIDALTRNVAVYSAGREVRTFRSEEPLTGSAILNGFAIDVQRLFADPAWWNPGPRN